MEEDDETQSLQSPVNSFSPPPPPQTPSSPPPPSNSVTVASVKPKSNALALVVHQNGGGGGRDDCWSEEATKVLIEAWGDRFSEPGKGTLKQQQWKEVAEIVNNSGQCKYSKTDIQCKNRIDTVKKKYKQEKAKIASGDGSSKWVFFKKLETLIGGSNNITMKSSEKAPMSSGVLVNRNMYKRQAKGGGGGGGTPILSQQRSWDSMRWHFRKRSASETESESDPEPEPEDSAESLPPLQPVQSFQFPKRFKVDKSGGGGGGSGGVGEVAKAIFGFTEAYEKAETAKVKLMVELEKERMKFAKEMELQRMQFLKTQMEITKNNQEVEERNKRGERRVVDDDDDDNDDDDRNVKNNGDVSS